MNSLFVTGTDTEIGKTCISIALIELLQQRGHYVAGMKPVASGCEVTSDGLRNDDALKLHQHANVKLSYDIVNPYAFKPAIAPHIAAKQIGVEIDLNFIKQCFSLIQQQTDIVVVEGAGGWLVPLNTQHTMADLAVQLGLPVVLVVGIRLGCINHALLTVQAIEKSGLSLMGWVANKVEMNNQSLAIVHTLKQSISAPCLGEIPYLSKGQQASNYIQLAYSID